ncbi:hypothetical protein ACFYOK_16905 [Microbispora bryophytorum]|uniref:hypothetical protein n=1 Tax=Microbispora bryophytorum TaxID=1460882 RepID=UPI0033C28EED
MRRPIRLMTLAALTCAGLLATAPAYAGCGCDAPKAAKPAAAAADLNVGVGLGVGLDVGLDLGLDLGLNAQAGANQGTMSCGKPTVLRRCH